MDKYNICTISGEKYLLKVLALYRSLQKNSDNFHLWILAMDENAETLLNLSNLQYATIIKLESVEDDKLKEAKQTRKMNEYCWTLKAPLIKYVQNETKGRDVVYVDSDLFFLKDPSIIFETLKENSIYLTAQRDLDYVEHTYGRYQAGLIGFKSDWEGRTALNWWESRCIEWCEHRYDEVYKRYGDQRYLDELPYLFTSVKVESNYGINAAPWNSIYSKERSIEIKKSSLKINDDDIVCFHFSCINMFNLSEFDLWSLGNIEIPTNIINGLYVPYLKVLANEAKNLLNLNPDIKDFIFSNELPTAASTYYKHSEQYIRTPYNTPYNICSVVSYKYIIRAITLYLSLEKHSENNFHMWFCAVDNDTHNTLKQLNLQNATIIHADEMSEDVLKYIKVGRSEKEYCWTLKSILIDHLLTEYSLKSLLYCDSDMYFFSSIKYIFNEWSSYSFYLCAQRANEMVEHNNGHYQAGLLGFKNDYYGKKVLSWWKEKCINWCYEDHDYELTRWGDQKYLDRVPEFFENIKVSQNLGINSAPWNLILNDKSYIVAYNEEYVHINNYILCCYHFGSMNMYDTENFDLWKHSPIKIKKEIMDYIYTPYILSLNQTAIKLENTGINIEKKFDGGPIYAAKNYYKLGKTFYV